MCDNNELYPKNPCIRCCCLDSRDICIGCFRSLEEILEWHSASISRKEQILATCQGRKAVAKK
ncbi:DUF1289 domain-containing protein [Pseudoalteromonas shioyasakiensis]|uniref:DUF1289 domain-containing protein n=1 Tax=Pseudoalteromonas shioyasakiensis TaxID=1190813 RepID=UPI00211764F9|nr:DUF1289 domain-containing protein [Pseudoalteromonas shioyasakiensis]MCQ8878050.1 DUF1289 domain-containing protein [Pseudoalteromonas shioyasakiensis]